MTLQLGMACFWESPARSTWSGTPWHLREALREEIEVTDVGPELSTGVVRALKVAGLRRGGAGRRSVWRYSSTTIGLLEHDVRRRVAAGRPDVVLEIGDLAVLPVPYVVMQDLSYSLLLERFGPDGVPHFRALGRRRLDMLRRRQEEVYASAAGLLPMSEWLARDLRRAGVDADRIHVVNPAVNVPMDGLGSPPVRRTGPVRRLLMIGKDFDTKGGDQVVAAFAILRRDLGASIELTIAGPAQWPLRGEIPEGITFLGRRPADEIPALLDAHDLFVLPSRFEGFGIAFVEALVRGLPCIGRDDCAMPEIIDPVSGGRLVRSDDPGELAQLVVDTLADDALYDACARAAAGRSAHFRWARAAREVAAVVQSVAGN